MKSSIFGGDKGPNISPSGKPRSSRSMINRSRTSNHAANSGKTKTFTWNLDDLINTYQDTGSLPPILSPTLPGSENNPTIISHMKKEKETTKRKKEEFDDDQIPLSMLSPTLPPAFDDSKSANQIQQPIPRKPINIKEDILLSPTPTKAKIRWINKMNDSTKPKFLLRVVFDNKKKYKESLLTEENLIGLGISSIEVTKASNTQSKVEKAGLSSVNDKEKHKKLNNQSGKRLPNSIQKEGNKIKNSLSVRELELIEKENALKLREKLLLEHENKLKAISESKNSLKLDDSKNNITKSANKSQIADKSSVMNKKLHWIKLAKNCKLSAEKSNSISSIIMEVDALLMFIIAYDYDEKFKVIGKVLPSERHWKSLDEDISKIIKKIKAFQKTQESTKLDFLRFLVCLLNLTRTSILKRINTITAKFIDSYNKKSDKEGNEESAAKIIELQQSIISNFGLMSEYMQASQPNELYSYISNRFPKTWANRKIDIDTIQPNQENLFPSKLKYYLPIGIYSNLYEMCGLLYSFLSEYINNQPAGKIDYSLQSGQL